MAQAAFSKQQRLLSAQAFDGVFAARQRVRRGPFVVAWQKVPKQEGQATAAAQLGIAISKRHARSAPLRNRIKRNIREVFRQHAISAQAVQCVVHLGQSVNDQNISRKEWQKWVDEALSLLLTRLKP